jgi:hypothetical protein
MTREDVLCMVLNLLRFTHQHLGFQEPVDPTEPVVTEEPSPSSEDNSRSATQEMPH